MELVEPSVAYKDSYIRAVKEFREDTANPAKTKRFLETPIGKP